MIFGIDLGTSNSLIAYMKDGKPTIIKNSNGESTTPSAISFCNGVCEIGSDAKKRKVRNAEDTVFSVKKFIGKKFHEVAETVSSMPYKIINENDEILININGKKMSVPEISAQVLSKLKKDAEEATGLDVEKVVITVPAYFSDTQREATKLAAKLAGLDCVRVLSEPTSASLAYGFTDNSDKTIAVYDLGGGTFDISILQIKDGVYKVLSTNGNTLLGGDDIDNRISNWICSQIKRSIGVDIQAERNNPMNMHNANIVLQWTRDEAEKAKIAMSSVNDLTIKSDDLWYGKAFECNFSMENFNHICHFVTDATFKCCDQALSDAGITKEDLDDVILVGGSTKSSFIRDEVKHYFGKINTSMNPDEAVALGAAIKGAILEGEIDTMSLSDVIPITLGIWSAKDKFVPIIRRNTTIPCSKTVKFTTAKDNVNCLSFPICQGEDENARKNTLIGKLMLSGIKEDKASKALVEVSFDVDKDGITKVSVHDTESGNTNSIRLQKVAV